MFVRIQERGDCYIVQGDGEALERFAKVVTDCESASTYDHWQQVRFNRHFVLQNALTNLVGYRDLPAAVDVDHRPSNVT
jgi:hypothetical protein